MIQRFKTPNFAAQKTKKQRIVPRECHEHAQELALVNVVMFVGLFFIGGWRMLCGVWFCISRAFVFLFLIIKLPFKALRNTSRSCIRSTVRYANSFQPPERWQRRLASFAAVSAVLALPFPMALSLHSLRDVSAHTKERASLALHTLQAGGEAMKDFRLGEAQQTFRDAFSAFQEAQGALQTINGVILEGAKFLPYTGKKIIDAENILEAGKEISHAGEILAETGAIFTDKKKISGTDVMPLTQELSSGLAKALPDIQKAYSRIEAVDEGSIPNGQRELFIKGKEALGSAVSELEKLHDAVRALEGILGGTQSKRYLVVFQNNTEIRATGGFLGSFAIVDIDRGVIKKIDVPGGGPYDLNGSLREHTIAPGPLHLINPRWQFQDANWFPDFPTSARKMMWFYEKSGRSSVDGVIAINARVFQDLLGVIGPISLPEYGKTINADNFFDETQKAVERDYDKKANKPKQFIGDLFSKTLERLESLDTETGLKIAHLMLERGITRDIQAYLKDESLQSFISHHGIDGRVLPAPADYLMIVDSNVGGDKSDRVMNMSVNHTIIPAHDGSLTTTLEITRTHTGKAGELFAGKKNIDFMRIYVPEGSTVLSSKGFQPPEPHLFKNPPLDYSEDEDLRAIQGQYHLNTALGVATNNEFGKTVLSGWVQTDPGATTTVTISYRLPFTLKDLRKKAHMSHAPYTLLLQRQSGSTIKEYHVSLSLPAVQDLLWSHIPPQFTVKEPTTWRSDFSQDATLGFLLK